MTATEVPGAEVSIEGIGGHSVATHVAHSAGHVLGDVVHQCDAGEDELIDPPPVTFRKLGRDVEI